MNSSRLYYIDNLRIFLISLVVLHHLAITYGAPGGWYYNEYEAGFPEVLPLAMFVASNQSFFMGMFFLISAIFLLPSLQRKGTGKFLKDRFIRLGIPLLVFYFLLSPLTVFIRSRFIDNENHTFGEFIKNGWGQGFGPLWFVEALLFFTLIALAIKPWRFKAKLNPPVMPSILAFAIFTGLLQFIIRIWLPVGWSMPFTNFQFPFFVQYIFLFAFGIIAYQSNWLDSISFKMGKRWILLALIFIFLGFPLLFIFGGAIEHGPEPFMGGITLQSLGYSVWEQVTGFSLILGLAGIFKRYFNKQGKIAKLLSDSAYGVFIFHAPVIVGLSALFKDWEFFPPYKLLILSIPSLLTCFLLVFFLRKIPWINKVI